MAVTRRGVLVGALAGGGLALGYMLRPRSYPLPLHPHEGEFAFDAWIRIGADGVVTVSVPQVEMGQGVTTLIPQIVAHELGADWRQIAAEPAPVSARYANLALAAKWAPLWMPLVPSLADDPDDLLTRRWAQDEVFDVTADGTAIAAYEAAARAAAASARAMLAQAAAARWNVGWEECEVANGFVTHENRKLPFGPLAAEAARYSPPSTPPLRAEPMSERAGEFPPGAPLRYPRLDLPSKIDGSWTFAGDVRLPGMVFAAIRHGPIGRRTFLSDLDEGAAKGVPGFLRTVRSPEGQAAWVAAVATNGWAAEQALARMEPGFRVAAGADSDAVDTAMDEALHNARAHRIHSAGDMALVRDRLPIQIGYEVSPAIHAGIETAAATAWLHDGKLELWIGTQAPQAVRKTVAAALDMHLRDVVLYPVAIGGSFDRRLEHGQAVEAALIARAVSKPVQLTWSRREEFRAGLPRAPVSAVMAARPDSEGQIAGWRARITVPATAREFGRRLLHGDAPYDALEAVALDADPMALEGAVPPYAIPNLAIDHVPVRIGLPTARMRGNAHGWTAFFNESFIDELAHKAGREPLSYRMAMLGHDPRLAACLQRVAALSQWGGGSDASGQGLACHVIDAGGIGGRIAVVASARREAEGVRVDRLSAVVDVGRIVNLDIARQQVEGGLVFGLGLALGCAVRYAGGRPDSESLAAMGLPTLADCPAIEVDFIESREDPADPGELGVAAVAPAVANALFSATGLRLRRLPFFAEDV
ncbi:xanthine dehydrogenase family protein molybdopterin-binding subunit [Novosphingobium guangzhouense]|uniref:Xanthine dehydrogenase n=1 Tax=Novosphingobium guangzhouense TaxID=1850347 RepID=A0A2K2G4E9_9SPHN|nr:molybdopterin cofactor-binding domain-containing protein [Novosphingobium guangzhouense]PNU05925.1 xanthine dehydrogenase [Novosphingobium guangzhouense]